MESMLKAETSGSILRNHFTLNTFQECAAAASMAPPPQRRRVFDVFPFFGGHELDILEMRLHELGSVVDVFVPIEARLTHSGVPKPLNWAERGVDEMRFANFTVRGFEANLSQIDARDNWAAATGDLNLAREEKQRDAALEALVAIGATADDLVIVADADELVSAAAIEAIKRCDRDDAMLPTMLEMTWFLYSFKWRARHRWGLFAREGAVVVSARMLGIGASDDLARSATAWRRQFRDRILAAHGGSRARVVADAGWHVSSFGGSDAVAAKLASYIGVSEYGSDFYRDADRLQRLADAGLAYYELAGYEASATRLFECRNNDSDDDLPRLAHKFWSFHAHTSCELSSPRDTSIEADVVEARLDAAANGHFVLGGWASDDGSFAKKRVFEPRLKCSRFDTDQLLDYVYIQSQLKPQCDEQGLTHSACDQAYSMLSKQCEAQLRATSLFYGNDQPPSAELHVAPSISFEETTAVPITVDGHTTHLALSSTDNVDDLANRTCVDLHIPLDQCPILAESLRSMQPAKAWVAD